MVSRRKFIQSSSIAGLAGISGAYLTTLSSCSESSKNITIRSGESRYVREPLIRPFGFKGVYQNEFWVTAALIESSTGIRHVGKQTQCLAWSDLDVFLAHPETDGNLILIKTLDYALEMIEGQSFRNPIELQEAILDDVHKYGESVTNYNNLSKTFTLSSMVALDNALWMLYADESAHTGEEYCPNHPNNFFCWIS
jgi:hypothetical protein